MRMILTALALIAASAAGAPAQPETVERSRTVFAVLCEDDPAMTQIRETALDAHLAHVAAHVERYAIAGPLLDETGAMTRSLFLIYAENEAEARAFMARDPYVAGGLYAQMEYRRFVPAAGQWIGGVIWDQPRDR
ncbi:MAG: YciI family protein [Oceanicaulis sp.]